MTFAVQVVSPEQILYEDDADMLVCRTLGGGDIAFLTGHAPFLGALDVWPLVVHRPDGSRVRIASHGGFVQVTGDRVIILSDIAELGDTVDVARARDALERAEAALQADPEDAAADAAARRARARLEVAGAA
jgi:F-type H+-transporting ATPase subunit epsilon